jgi:hypothetical protein
LASITSEKFEAICQYLAFDSGEPTSRAQVEAEALKMIEWVSQADDEVGVFVEPKLRELLLWRLSARDGGSAAA